jgi:hypothetical protein
VYYALGGDAGMVGRPAPEAHFRRDNLLGAVIIPLAALFPQIAWRRRALRRTLPVVGWSAAVAAACTPKARANRA